MARKKKTDRADVIAKLQSRGPLTEEERPVVILTRPVELTSAERTLLAASPWVPHSACELCDAALDTFQRALGSELPPEVPQLVAELKHKMEGAEYHLRKVSLNEAGQWWEAEAFLTQARGTLEILARILNSVLHNVPDSFDRDGTPIANMLRNQPIRSRHYGSSIALADLIQEDELARELSAVRDAIHHRYGLPSLAKAKTGTIHLGGLTLEEFCIGKWLSLMKFTREFLEWTISIAWEARANE